MTDSKNKQASIKPQLLLFPPVYSTLIYKEELMFSQEYNVITYDFRSTEKSKALLRFIGQFFFLLRHIGKTQIMVSRFVGYQTILPILFSKITGKPVVCIMGGLECIKFPSVKTGSYIRPLFSTITKWCLRHATHLCPVHDSLILTEYTYQDDDYPMQGYKYFVKDCNTPVTAIRNGFDSSLWYRTADKLPNTFITVAYGLDKDHLFRLKGIDLILEVALDFPHCSFTIVGGSDPSLKVIPSNVHFMGETENKDLKDLYSSHEYYLQLSITEGFPNAVCEAMLCECIPIGSNVGALPEIVNDDRRILKRKNASQLKKILEYALTIDRKAEGIAARNHIKDNYTIERRRNSFFSLFNSILSRKN